MTHHELKRHLSNAMVANDGVGMYQHFPADHPTLRDKEDTQAQALSALRDVLNGPDGQRLCMTHAQRAQHAMIAAANRGTYAKSTD